MKGIIKINRKLNLSSFKEVDKGIYKNNPLNRKLGRVGQKYGKDKKEEELKFDVNLSTDEQYFDKSTNSWDERRIKNVHIPIIEKYTKGIKSHENPVVTLMMGAPSSGKGTVRNSIKNKEPSGSLLISILHSIKNIIVILIMLQINAKCLFLIILFLFSSFRL